jgi:hypothetical protein
MSLEAASALDTNGATALAPYTAPVASAPLRRKLARFMPCTSTSASSGFDRSVSVIVIFLSERSPLTR